MITPISHKTPTIAPIANAPTSTSGTTRQRNSHASPKPAPTTVTTATSIARKTIPFNTILSPRTMSFTRIYTSCRETRLSKAPRQSTIPSKCHPFPKVLPPMSAVARNKLQSPDSEDPLKECVQEKSNNSANPGCPEQQFIEYKVLQPSRLFRQHEVQNIQQNEECRRKESGVFIPPADGHQVANCEYDLFHFTLSFFPVSSSTHVAHSIISLHCAIDFPSATKC